MARILIADDEINIQTLLKEVLEGEGHSVSTVLSGGEVLAALKAQNPDLLILDVMLPGMDGLSLQKQIAEDPDLRELRVIVVTAQKAFLKMFNRFEQVAAKIEKPFSVAGLLATVQDVLSRRKART